MRTVIVIGATHSSLLGHNGWLHMIHFDRIEIKHQRRTSNSMLKHWKTEFQDKRKVLNEVVGESNTLRHHLLVSEFSLNFGKWGASGDPLESVLFYDKHGHVLSDKFYNEVCGVEGIRTWWNVVFLDLKYNWLHSFPQNWGWPVYNSSKKFYTLIAALSGARAEQIHSVACPILIAALSWSPIRISSCKFGLLVGKFWMLWGEIGLLMGKFWLFRGKFWSII